MDGATTRPIDLTAIGPGFADPVLDSQIVFRALMDAMARPGSIASPQIGLEAPLGLSRAAAAVLLTLADFETPVWLPPGLAAGPAGHYLRFHAGCRLVDDPGGAVFAVGRPSDVVHLLSVLSAGEDAYPDRSATLLVEVPSLEGGFEVRLSGPGIAVGAALAPGGVGAEAWNAVAANAERFPLGVDLVFTAGDRFCGLPRSTALSYQGETR